MYLNRICAANVELRIKGASILLSFLRNPIIGWKPARKSPSLQNANKYMRTHTSFLKRADKDISE